MNYTLLVHHDEATFDEISESKRQEIFAESVQLTHQLRAQGRYLSASPLHAAGRASYVCRICRVGQGYPICQYALNAYKKKPPLVKVAASTGGGGGNRTRVRKPYTGSTTCLAWSFNLTRAPLTGLL